MQNSERQEEVLDYIKKYWEKRHDSPTLPEIAVSLGISRQRVHQHIIRLEEKGELKREYKGMGKMMGKGRGRKYIIKLTRK